MIFLIKTAAALAVALGFALAGKCTAMFYTGRVRVIREALLLISAAETGIRYSHFTVRELLRELEKNGGFAYLDFMGDCRRLLDSGEPFPSAWRKSIEERGELCILLGEAAEYLKALGSDIGATDVEGQLTSCAYCKRMLTEELERREEKNRKSVRLFPLLGVMLGISAAIMII